MIPALLLHTGTAVNWRAWTFDPSVIGGSLVAVGLYFYLQQRWQQPISWRRAAAFLAGIAAIIAALVSPLDSAADRLLSMHMLQHVCLTTIGPPLLLLGLPPALLDRALPQGLPRQLLRLTVNPVLTATGFIVNMWLWHVPPIYELALNHQLVHIVMHGSFMSTALLFWWPVIQPLPELAPMREGARLLYLFATGFPMELLALLLIASNSVVYSFYASGPYLWGISPLSDQQVGGLIMGGLGEAASLVAIGLLFFRFLDRESSDPVAPRPADAA